MIANLQKADGIKNEDASLNSFNALRYLEHLVYRLGYNPIHLALNNLIGFINLLSFNLICSYFLSVTHDGIECCKSELGVSICYIGENINDNGLI